MHASDELTRLEGQLRSAFEGPAWHGPAVLELLRDVTPAEAATRPIGGAHTIWELVLHLTACYDLVLRRMRGDGRQLTEANVEKVLTALKQDDFIDETMDYVRSLADEAAQVWDPGRPGPDTTVLRQLPREYVSWAENLISR